LLLLLRVWALRDSLNVWLTLWKRSRAMVPGLRHVSVLLLPGEALRLHFDYTSTTLSGTAQWGPLSDRDAWESTLSIT
jgi:hypothetical protein